MGLELELDDEIDNDAYDEGDPKRSDYLDGFDF